MSNRRRHHDARHYRRAEWRSQAHAEFDLRGLTAFEEAVLRKALEIPRGEVRPYSWVAREIGHPGAARAVGTTLANNPVPLSFPVTGVVRGDGVIGNYLFGTEVKHALLEYEHAEPAKLDELARRGVRYFGSRTRIFCFPTCRHARRTTGPTPRRSARRQKPLRRLPALQGLPAGCGEAASGDDVQSSVVSRQKSDLKPKLERAS